MLTGVKAFTSPTRSLSSGMLNPEEVKLVPPGALAEVRTRFMPIWIVVCQQS